jgi:hypothetical protein
MTLRRQGWRSRGKVAGMDGRIVEVAVGMRQHSTKGGSVPSSQGWREKRKSLSRKREKL